MAQRPLPLREMRREGGRHTGRRRDSNPSGDGLAIRLTRPLHRP
ncbi:hypothetical protein P3T39_000628 [Kitasatospora sp. GP82]|nr:hypothetical protein [Kitasatospora sp. GP82]